jgi:hypothetical protein
VAEDVGLDRFRSLVSLAAQAFNDDFRYGEAMANQAVVVIQRRETSTKSQRGDREDSGVSAV